MGIQDLEDYAFKQSNPSKIRIRIKLMSICNLHNHIHLTSSTFLLLSVCRSHAALLIVMVSHSFALQFMPLCHHQHEKCSSNVNTFCLDLRGKYNPGSEVKAMETHGAAQGNGGTEERNAEWAKELPQKCLNAYSELPTGACKPELTQTPSLPLFLVSS